MVNNNRHRKYEKIKELLKNTNATAWRQLIEKANGHGSQEAKYLDKIVRLVRRYYENISEEEIRSIEFKEDPKSKELKDYHDYIVISEDGSIAPGDTISMMYYVVLSSAVVIFNGYYKNSIEDPLIEVRADLKGYALQKDISLIKREANLDMIREETRAMRRAINMVDMDSPAVLITDGPLIEPPQPIMDERYEKLINMRATTIREAMEKNILPIGFIKRIIGNIYSVSMREDLKQYQFYVDNETTISLANISDYTLTTFLFELKRNVLEEKPNSDFIIYTMPKEIPEDGIRSYRDYKDNGIFVYYSLTKLSGRKYPKRPIYRIEVPFLEEPSEKELIERFELALKILYLWTPVGLKYPLPISLAHQICTIKKPVAKVLVKEILTKFVSDYVTDLGLLEGDLLKYYLLDRGI